MDPFQAKIPRHKGTECCGLRKWWRPDIYSVVDANNCAVLEVDPVNAKLIASAIAAHEGRPFVERLVGEMGGKVEWKEEKDGD